MRISLFCLTMVATLLVSSTVEAVKLENLVDRKHEPAPTSLAEADASVEEGDKKKAEPAKPKLPENDFGD